MRRRAVGLGVLAALLTGVTLSAVPAAAHSSLVGSSPEDGAVLDEAPDRVVLEFDSDLQPDFSQVAVLDAEQNHYEDGDPESTGVTVTQVVTDMPAGEYSISYRVGSSDGHPVTGVISFTVDQPADGAASAAEQESEATAQDAAAGGTEDGDGSATKSIVAAVVAAGVVGLIGVLLLRRRPDATGEDSSSGQ